MIGDGGGSSGSGGGGGFLSGSVSTYADLPTLTTPSDYYDKMYIVLENSGGNFLSGVTKYYKYPSGIYIVNQDTDIWTSTPLNVKMAEDATTLINITDWTGFYDIINDINIGDRLVFDGIEYRNLTGSLTSDSPLIDTTNWSDSIIYLPIGWTYTQYPTKKHPTDLGMMGTWTNVSNELSGGFLRVDGGEASEFESGEQPGQERDHYHKITEQTYAAGTNNYFTNNNIRRQQLSGDVLGVSTTSRARTMDSANGEVMNVGDSSYPANYTIRIWERTA